MRPVKIFADSTADIPAELLEKYHISVTPLYVSLGEKTYKDFFEMKPQYIFDYYNQTGDLPKTAAVSVSDYEQAFKPFIDEGYDIIHFSISSDFSSCHQNAKIVAEELGNIYPIDSRNLSTGIAYLAVEAAELAEKGELSAEEIAELIREKTDKIDTSFVLDKLEFLHRGGRCSGVAALGANLLKLKPCIEVVDGKMTVAKKYRGAYTKCVAEYISDRLSDDDTIDTKRIFFTWTGCSKEFLDATMQELNKCRKFDEVIEVEAGSTISGHCGPNCFGIIYAHK